MSCQIPTSKRFRKRKLFEILDVILFSLQAYNSLFHSFGSYLLHTRRLVSCHLTVSEFTYKYSKATEKVLKHQCCFERQREIGKQTIVEHWCKKRCPRGFLDCSKPDVEVVCKIMLNGTTVCELILFGCTTESCGLIFFSFWKWKWKWWRRWTLGSKTFVSTGNNSSHETLNT